MEELKLTFIEHLAELRRRLIFITLAIIAGTGVSYFFVDKLTSLALEPAKELQFIYLSPPELFLAYIKIALVVGIAVTSPFTLLQIWSFLRPGLSVSERRYLRTALVAGVFFFLLGIVFAYAIIVPLTIQFFVSISFQDVRPMFSVASYVGFISSILLSFGLVFEMPIVVILLAKFGLVTAAGLCKHRKYVILGIVIAAAVLSPPDIVSQFLLAGPMLLLFEFSILIARRVDGQRQ